MCDVIGSAVDSHNLSIDKRRDELLDSPIMTRTLDPSLGCGRRSEGVGVGMYSWIYSAMHVIAISVSPGEHGQSDASPNNGEYYSLQRTKIRQRNQNQQVPRTKAAAPRSRKSSHSFISYYIHLAMLLSILQQNKQSFAQEVVDTNSPEYKGANNPQNKFCGISYNEAHQFCHLEPSKSLPCPNGAEEDCPYNMPCWEITEPCTSPPVPATGEPSASPISRRSDNAGDHNFCGLGFDNLYGW